jgi:hypothetical protein
MAIVAVGSHRSSAPARPYRVVPGHWAAVAYRKEEEGKEKKNRMLEEPKTRKCFIDTPNIL